MKIPKKLPKKQTNFFLRSILYIVFAVFCCFDFKDAWMLFLIFIALAAFYIYLWIKHKDDLSFSEILDRNTLKDDVPAHEMTKKERKQSFQDYLAKVEEEYDNTEIDELYNAETDDAEYDEEEYEDLYIK